MRIWLDDVREAPPGWVWIRYAEYLIPFLEDSWDRVREISLDHDLTLPMTGYDVVKWIEEKVYDGKDIPFTMVVHSANPVGRTNMVAGINSINRRKREAGGSSPSLLANAGD